MCSRKMKPHLGREVAASEYAHRLRELNKAVDKVQDCFHELAIVQVTLRAPLTALEKAGLLPFVREQYGSANPRDFFSSPKK